MYIAERRAVYVYDSLYSQYLNDLHQGIVHGRYGENVAVIFAKPAVRQSDVLSCGVFAIACITTILCNANPALYKLKLDPNAEDKTKSMRQHLREDKIELFPSEGESEHSDDEGVYVGAYDNPETRGEILVRESRGWIDIAIESLHESIELIGQPNSIMTRSVINYFIHLVRQQFKLDMLTMNAIADTAQPSQFDRTIDDIQITQLYKISNVLAYC